MYVCTYVCMYVRMHVRMYVCTYVCMYVRTYVRMYVYYQEYELLILLCWGNGSEEINRSRMLCNTAYTLAYQHDHIQKYHKIITANYSTLESIKEDIDINFVLNLKLCNAWKP